MTTAQLIGVIVNPSDKSSRTKSKTLDQWIVAKVDNTIYRFGGRNRSNPSAQTEGIENNQVKASTYGINNLKLLLKIYQV